MPSFARSFQTRIERRMALLFFGFCVVPLVMLTALSVRAIESQTLQVAERHLAEHAKAYAMQLIERLQMGAWELEHLGAGHAAGDPDPDRHAWRWIRPLATTANPTAIVRPTLQARAGGFEVSVPAGGRLHTGFLSDEALFAGLEHAPYGVRSCIRVAGLTRQCGGPDAEGPLLREQWKLSLASMYDTEVVIEIVSTRPRELVLRQIGVLYQVLPYAVFMVMMLGGWWVLGQLRARFAPVAELRQATERIRSGDYSGSVVIRSGDELEGLGEAFNAMTRRLNESFSTVRTLAEMDRMILDGANLEELVRQALMLMKDVGVGSGLVWLWDTEGDDSKLYVLNAERRLESRALPAADAAPPTLEDALAALREQWQGPLELCSPVMRDTVLTGVIAGTPGIDGVDRSATLDELGDRISVATTLHSRATALFRQTHYDGLTGLLNREAFAERLDRASRSSVREGYRGALICLDLDRFKQVNDIEGHHAGDWVLCRVGERLRRTVRATDEVARLGGDEFAVLVSRFEDSSDIDLLCRRIIESIQEPVEIQHTAHVMDASLGVTVFPGDGEDAPALLRKAEVAMYKAKEQSGGTFTFFDAAMNRDTEQRARTEARLRQALSHRELTLYFQPKVRLNDHRVVGVEGLLRWPSEPGMHPGIFIPVAEHTGLIHEFTRLLVEDASVCLDRCRGAGYDVDRVGINVSARQFQRRGFAEEFLELVDATGAAPADFEVEVTESVFVDDPRAVAADLELLRRAGVTIALDDFGTGYSSLNMLRELPLDVIKIDRSFIAPISTSPQARDFLGRIIDIIRSLGLVCVAEGVETEREMQILAARQCDIVQGFLISPAVSVEELLGLLERRSARSA